MSIEENKKVVRAWFDAVNRGDEDAIRDLTTEDFHFATKARQPEWLLYDWDRDQFAKVPTTMSTMLTSPIQLKLNSIIAEGDTVAAEAETDMKMLSGKRYNNAYHFVFRLRDGKFYEVLEYSCSYLAANCFGAVEPGKPEQSAMAS